MVCGSKALDNYSPIQSLLHQFADLLRCAVLRRKEFAHQGSPCVSKVRTLLPRKRSSGMKFTLSRLQYISNIVLQ
ncbi:Hypp3770 [Branchiostoma lanceolatum]|uniref:Hypp3770 protein n=1 Tax=Branchiostoma lanceolatum TaxID=7740 RepID=A0A8K0A2W8_BRALA|nr:Hypp3770 [Branchiostoma lanceolatum]